MGSNPGLAMFFLFFSPKWDKKWVFACQSFDVCTARVKLELTDFSFCIGTNVTANFRFGILFQNGELFMITKNLVTHQFASVK